MPSQDGRRLGELDVAVVDDLDPVAPGIAEVQPPAGLDLHVVRGFERGAHRLLVVDDEPEVAPVVRALLAPLGQREELVAQVDEGHAGRDAPQVQLEEPAVELQRLVDAVDLERYVVDSDELWKASRHRIRT